MMAFFALAAPDEHFTKGWGRNNDLIATPAEIGEQKVYTFLCIRNRMLGFGYEHQGQKRSVELNHTVIILRRF
jgi:hypothetical protein